MNTNWHYCVIIHVKNVAYILVFSPHTLKTDVSLVPSYQCSVFLCWFTYNLLEYITLSLKMLYSLTIQSWEKKCWHLNTLDLFFLCTRKTWLMSVSLFVYTANMVKNQNNFWSPCVLSCISLRNFKFLPTNTIYSIKIYWGPTGA